MKQRMGPKTARNGGNSQLTRALCGRPRRTQTGWRSRMEFELSGIPSGANRRRIGTVELGKRDERDQLPVIGPEPAVSGSDSAVPPSQDPAKAREFLGGSRGAAAKSLQPQTRWRWGESGANPSLPVEQGKYRELSRIRGHRGASRIGETTSSGCLRRDFPGQWNRERPPGEQGIGEGWCEASAGNALAVPVRRAPSPRSRGRGRGAACTRPYRHRGVRAAPR